MEFSFPLNLGDENLQGELRWKAEKAPSPQPWITFSLENRKVSLQKTTGNLKLQLAETLPLHLKIPQVSLENAGSGNLTLTLAKGTLHQEVNLVVMKCKGWAEKGQAGVKGKEMVQGCSWPASSQKGDALTLLVCLNDCLPKSPGCCLICIFLGGWCWGQKPGPHACYAQVITERHPVLEWF